MIRSLWAGLCAAVRGLGGIAKSALTAPDGTSWAPGRIMGFGVFVIGQCLVIRASQSVLIKGLSVSEWTAFLQGIATFEALDCAVATGLVLGMAPTDPFGKWWGKDAATPDKAPGQ